MSFGKDKLVGILAINHDFTNNLNWNGGMNMLKNETLYSFAGTLQASGVIQFYVEKNACNGVSGVPATLFYIGIIINFLFSTLLNEEEPKDGTKTLFMIHIPTNKCLEFNHFSVGEFSRMFEAIDSVLNTKCCCFKWHF